MNLGTPEWDPERKVVKDRVFHVTRRPAKKKRHDGWIDTVIAQECVLVGGDLVFRTSGHLVRSIAAGTWSDLEESEVDD